jgi:hypothetical protein
MDIAVGRQKYVERGVSKFIDLAVLRIKLHRSSQIFRLKGYKFSVKVKKINVCPRAERGKEVLFELPFEAKTHYFAYCKYVVRVQVTG